MAPRLDEEKRLDQLGLETLFNFLEKQQNIQVFQKKSNQKRLYVKVKRALDQEALNNDKENTSIYISGLYVLNIVTFYYKVILLIF